MWPRSPSLTAKAMAVFGLLFLVSAGLAGVAARQLGAVNAGARELEGNWLPSVRALGEVGYRIAQARAAEGSHLVAAGAGGGHAAAALDAALDGVAAARAAYEALPRAADEAMLYDGFARAWDAYLAALARVLDASRADTAQAAALYGGVSQPAFEAASARLAALADHNVARGTEEALGSQQAYQDGLRLLAAALAAQAALVALATAAFARGFVRPVVRLTEVMADLARQDTSVTVPDQARDDEVGSMARSVEVFRVNAIELEGSRARLAEQAEALEVALAREREAAAVQRDFVAMASHEFRTPLTVIDGQAQRILKRRDAITPDELAERAGKVRAAAQRLTRAIDGFFRLARSPEGRPPFEPAPLDLPALVAEACQAVAEEGRPVELRLGGLPGTVDGDAALVRQALDNLLDNAVKYSPPGSPVAVEGRAEPGWAVLSVADRGVGLPGRDRDRLFDRYHRGDNVGEVPGTGVGLHAVRVLAGLHGGRVEAADREGGGAVFTLRLPAGTGLRAQAGAA